MSDSSRTVAEVIVDWLEQLPVRNLFGNPGTTELPFVRAVRDSDLSYRLCLHEDVAVGCAAGLASTERYSDFETPGPPVGVANLHTAAGLSHGLSNLYGARVARAPTLVVVGTQSLDFRHEDPILSDRCEPLLEEPARWFGEITEPSAALPLLRTALRQALTPPRGPSVLMLPLDVSRSTADPSPVSLGDLPSPGSSPPEKVDELAELCLQSPQLGIVFGDELGRSGRDGIRRAVDLAERTGALVYGEILAAECNFPPEHEQWVSILPPDTDLSRKLLDLDTVVFVGCNHQTGLFENVDGLIPEGTTCVQINTCPDDVGRVLPVDLGLSGDPVAILDDLNDRLGPSVGEDLLREREALREGVKALVEEQLGDLKDSPASSEFCTQRNVVEVMNEVAGDALIVDEGVTGRFELLTEGNLRPERYLSNKGGALGYGLPAALGAAFAVRRSDRDVPVLGYVGDGSFWYYPQALHTARRYDLDLTVLVLRNDRYQILEDNAETIMGEPPDFRSTRLDGLSGADAADAQSVRSHHVQQRDDLETTLEEELTRPGPAVVEIDLTES